MEKKYWFGSKYGFGWYPINLKGILVFTAYFSFLIYVFLKINSTSHSMSETIIGFLPFLFGATVLLLFVCYLTGEPIKIKKLKI